MKEQLYKNRYTDHIVTLKRYTYLLGIDSNCPPIPDPVPVFVLSSHPAVGCSNLLGSRVTATS